MSLKNTLRANLRATITAAPLLLLSTFAVASECNDFAPLADPENPENGYFNLQGQPLSEANRLQLEKLSAALTGKWRGTQLAKTCEGHHESPTSHLERYPVNAEISRHATGAVRMDAEKERLSDRVVKLDTMFLTPESDTEYGRTPGWHTLEFLDDNTVVFSEKSRVRNGNNFARMIHKIKKVQLVDNKLTVDSKVYVNGYFVEQTGWSLSR